ncbi:MAG: helix-turn-helix transcriptional regulator [Anaerolineales bacterium]
MVDTNPELLAKIKTLSKRELEVLILRCQGMKYEAIGKTLSISVSTVKEDMSRTYMKLGLDTLEPAARLKSIYDTICPFLKQAKQEREGTEAAIDGEVVPEEEKPIPEKVKDMVEKDGLAIIPIDSRPQPIIHQSKENRKGISGFVWLVIGVVLGICLSTAAVVAFFRATNGQVPFIPQPTPTIPTPTIVPSDTPVPSPTPIIPTQTPKVVTQVVVVTATPLPATQLPQATTAPTSIPTSSISLPFADNFNNGANPAWQPITSQGTWRVINGRYTETGETTFLWSYSLVGDPNWQDYTVDVDYSLELDNAAGLAVLVRAGGQSNLGLAFVINNYEASWRIWQNGQWQKLVTSTGGPSMQGHIKVQVQGSTFTASANGISPLVITDTSTSSGMVGLGVLCRDPASCPTFDNFSVK